MTMPSDGYAIRKDCACLDESPTDERFRGLESDVFAIGKMAEG